MKARIKKVLLWAFGFLAVAVLGLFLYLQFADLSGWCEAAVDAASDALGREVSVAGECRPDIGFPSSLVLEEVSIANSGWSEQPEMVSVERFVFVLDLWSVVNRPVRVPRVRLEGGRLLLETEGQRNNWSFGGEGSAGAGESADEAEPQPKEVPAEDAELMVVLEDIVLRDVALTFQADGVVRTALSVEELKLGFREAGMFRLDAAGALNEKRFAIAGDVGPFDELMTLGAVTADLEVNLLGTEVVLKASFGDLASLAEPVIEAAVQGSDLQTVTTGLGLPDLGSGAFSLSGHLTGPSLEETVEVSLEVTSDLVAGEIGGRLSSVLDPQEIEARVALRGPALEAVATISGVEELPAGPFDLEGGLKWADDSLELDQIVAHVGPNSLTANGHVSFSTPEPEFDVVLSADGPDLTAVVDLPSLALPNESFRVSGRVASLESGFQLEGVEVALGESSARIEGVVGAIPALEGTQLQIEFASPNLSSFSALAGVTLPPMRTELSGGVALSGSSATLTAVALALGEHQGEFDGRVIWSAPFVGSDLTLALEGPSLAGLVGWIPPEMVELPVLPGAAYRVVGRLAVSDEGYQLGDVEIDLGDETVIADGLVGLLPELEGSDLTLELSSPNLTSLADLAAPFVELPVLPAESLNLAGRVQVAGGVYRLDGVRVELGQNHVEATGPVGPISDLSATNLDLQVSGPDLGDVLDHLAAAGFDELPLLPREAFSVEGGVEVVESRYALRDVRAQLGEIRLTATGMVGAGELLAGSDLEVEASGPDLSVFGTLTEVSLPAEPFRISGRIERGVGTTRVEGLRALLGDVNLEAEGVIGDPPDLESSDIELRVRSGGTRLFAQFLGSDIPEGIFEAEGHFSGQADNFAVGAMRALLTSDRVDLGELFDAVSDRRREEAEVAAEADEIASAAPPVAEQNAEIEAEPGLLFVDDPLGFRGLMKLNGVVRYRVEHLTSPSFDLEECRTRTATRWTPGSMARTSRFSVF
jgi:hypothetical protein